MSFEPLLQAGANLIPIFSVGLILIIFYVFIIGPQKREQKKTQEMIAALQKGDKVITIGGIHGIVSSLKDNTIILKVDDTCKIEMNRSAIAHVILDEKAKSNRGKAVQETGTQFSFFKKKDKRTDESDAGKPKPPDFTQGTV